MFAKSIRHTVSDFLATPWSAARAIKDEGNRPLREAAVLPTERCPFAGGWNWAASPDKGSEVPARTVHDLLQRAGDVIRSRGTSSADYSSPHRVGWTAPGGTGGSWPGGVGPGAVGIYR